MKVLIVKKKYSCWPFVEEQARALCALNEFANERVEVDWHLIEGKGIIGYLLDVVKLINDIKYIRPDVIHAHYGMSGYYACLVTRLLFWRKRVPLVITYHGSDINLPKVRKLSQQAILMADYNIFVSPKLMEQVEHRENSQVIPCGLNMEDWMPMDKRSAREKMGLSMETRYVLFCSDFQTAVKNPELAKSAICNLKSKMGYNIELIELKDYTREQVNALMHGADVCLMTSFAEGSPQFVKEAMVCCCPIVTTRVGDVEYVIGNTEGCYYTDYTTENCVKQIEKALQFAEQHDRTNGKERILQLGYDNEVIAYKIKEIYHKLVSNIL